MRIAGKLGAAGGVIGVVVALPLGVKLVEGADRGAGLERVERLPWTPGRRSMGDPGFEPGTSSLSETRSNQLS